MPMLRTIYRLVRIAALCLVVVNLHGAAVAGPFKAAHDCPSVGEPGHSEPINLHHVGCCTNLHCCPIPAEPPCADTHAIVHIPVTPILPELSPFLLVRAFHPPPKFLNEFAEFE